jgi:hypothetical protein
VKIFLVLLASIAGAHALYAQKNIEEREQTWVGYFHQSRLTKRSGLWVDLHWRATGHYLSQTTMSVTRLAYIFHINEQVRLMAGYAYANRYNQSGIDVVREHRPWQQVQWTESKKRFTLTQAFRLEQRFRENVVNEKMTDGFTFNWRFRYNTGITIPFHDRSVSATGPYFSMSNEIHVNAGKSIVYNYFDQNRTFCGLGYQFTSQLHANLGYLFIFQQNPAPGHFNHTHAIRLFVYHQVDWRGR